MATMTSNQYGYPKCDLCIAANDFSKKTVYLVVVDDEKKVRCEAHGGSGSPIALPTRRL